MSVAPSVLPEESYEEYEKRVAAQSGSESDDVEVTMFGMWTIHRVMNVTISHSMYHSHVPSPLPSIYNIAQTVQSPMSTGSCDQCRV